MRPLPRRVYIAVLIVVCAACGAFAVAVAVSPWQPRLVTWLMAGEIAVAVGVSLLVPVPLANRTLHYVNTTAFLLATVLLPAPLAMAEVALAWIVTDQLQRVDWTESRRVPWLQTAFNAAQAALRVGAGALVFRAVSGTALVSGTLNDRVLLAVVAAGAAMYVINQVLLHGIVSVQSGQWRLAGLVRLVRVNAVQDGSLILLGVLGAIIAGRAPLAIAVPLAFTVVIHREMARARGTALVDLVNFDEAQRPIQATGGTTPLATFAWWAS
ncbi:MAG TPA: hypothetical protein VFD32_15690 [Dehalococcoidia bacterium]|nr:hypothetical protein [Dehalococcoidia bacterium]